MVGCGGGGPTLPASDAAIASPHCTPASFEAIMPTVMLAPADEVALPVHAAFVITGYTGMLSERDPSFASPVPMIPTPYTIAEPAVSPDGNELYYSLALDTPQLHHAHRSGPGQWTEVADAPAYSWAGTPSATAPVRMMVDNNDGGAGWQELEQTASGWKPVGAPYPIDQLVDDPAHHPSQLALSSDGLLLLYSTSSPAADQTNDLRFAIRASLADRFGAPTVIAHGLFRDATLSDDCKALFAVLSPPSGPEIVRFDQP